MKPEQKERFIEGAFYKTGYITESGRMVRGRDAQCVSVSNDRKTAVFKIERKEQQYSLIGEMTGPEMWGDGLGIEKREVAVLPQKGIPAYSPYTSIYSSGLISRVSVARKNAGLTIAAMAREFEIPIRTIENWEAGKSDPPAWAEKLLVEKLEQMEPGE